MGTLGDGLVAGAWWRGKEVAGGVAAGEEGGRGKGVEGAWRTVRSGSALEAEVATRPC